MLSAIELELTQPKITQVVKKSIFSTVRSYSGKQ